MYRSQFDQIMKSLASDARRRQATLLALEQEEKQLKLNLQQAVDTMVHQLTTVVVKTTLCFY